jgi:protein-tyrosine-phosphatase
VRLHWSLEDPAAAEGGEMERLEAFRRIRDRLRERIRAFVADKPVG